MVHCDDVVEVLKVPRLHLPSAGIQLYPVLLGDERRASVRTFSDVPGTGARRVDLESVRQPFLLNEVPEHTFR